MAVHTLRIDFDAATGALAVTATAAATVAGGPVARVSLPLNFDPAAPAPELKRREGETDEQYDGRLLRHTPAQLDAPPELAAGLKEACAAITGYAADVLAHYARRAAAAHALDADGVLPDGVTHKLRLGRKSKPARGDAGAKKE